jgi:hypothetical protein
MKRLMTLLVAVMASTTAAFAQTPPPTDPAFEKALMPAPRQMREGATIIK